MPALDEIDDSLLDDKTQYHCRRQLVRNVITLDDGKVDTKIFKDTPQQIVARMDDAAYQMRKVRSLRKVGKYITCTVEWGLSGAFFMANPG